VEQKLKLKNEEKFDKTKEENVQTVIETQTDLSTSKVNVELAERKITTTKEEKIVEGEKKKLIDIDESKEVQNVSYPRIDNVYDEKAQELSVKTQDSEEKGEEESKSISKPKLVFIKLEIPEKERFTQEEFDSVETADSEDLKPSIKFTIEEDETGEFIEKVEQSELTETVQEELETNRARLEQVLEEQEESYSEDDYEAQGENDYQGKDVDAVLEDEEEEYEESFEKEFGIELDLDQDIAPEVEKPSRIVKSLNDFEGLEEHSFASRGVLKADYDPAESVKGVSERVIVSLDEISEYDSISGSEVVEYIGEKTALDATVTEIPYFSENSGPSWDEGWNSFDMVLQMGDMDFQNMEYMVSEMGENRGNPAKQSIGSNFDSSKVMEFRESQEWSNHQEGYEASEETLDAWIDEYGEGVLELDPIERGIYASIIDGNEFRGSEIDFTDLGLENGDILQSVYESREVYREDLSFGSNGKLNATALS